MDLGLTSSGAGRARARGSGRGRRLVGLAVVLQDVVGRMPVAWSTARATLGSATQCGGGLMESSQIGFGLLGITRAAALSGATSRNASTCCFRTRGGRGSPRMILVKIVLMGQFMAIRWWIWAVGCYPMRPVGIGSLPSKASAIAAGRERKVGRCQCRLLTSVIQASRGATDRPPASAGGEPDRGGEVVERPASVVKELVDNATTRVKADRRRVGAGVGIGSRDRRRLGI